MSVGEIADSRTGGAWPGGAGGVADGAPVRVLIVDDHRLICIAMRMILEREGFLVVGEARTGRQAIEMAKELSPDVILLDIVMPDMDGLQALSGIRSSLPRTSILMLTAYARPDFMARAIAMGAAGYITKEEEPARIARAVRSVVEGEAIVSREMLALAVNELHAASRLASPASDEERPSLTPQQRRVLSLIAEGFDNATIAQTLSVSRNTVKTHIRDLFAKLGVSDRTQAAIWALRHNLLG